MSRLDIDQLDAHVLPGAHRVDGNIKSPVAVLLRQCGFPVGLFFLLVNFAGLLFFQHFASDGLPVDPVGEFTNGGFFRNREGINCLQVDIVRIAEHLFDASNCIAVFNHYADMVLHKLELRQA